MADLKSIRRDVTRINKGEELRLFVHADPEQDVYVTARGIDRIFRDEVQRRLRDLARKYGGNVNNIPSDVARKVDIELYIDRLLTGVRGLNDGDRRVEFEEFCKLLPEEDYLELWLHVQAAVHSFSGIKVEDAEVAAKN